MRHIVFSTDEIYHIYNRGIDLRTSFSDKREYSRAVQTIDYYRFKNPLPRLALALVFEKEKRKEFFEKIKKKEKKLVEIICYCLMPNHFHLLLRQKKEGGITRFVSNFSNSYTRYFNTKHKRIGPIFQGIFKAVRIESDEQLLHVSRYIHLNPVASSIVKEHDLEKYIWSSLPEYLGFTNNKICDKELILGQFSSGVSYRKFIYDQIDYAKKLEVIKHLLLE